MLFGREVKQPIDLHFNFLDEEQLPNAPQYVIKYKSDSLSYIKKFKNSHLQKHTMQKPIMVQNANTVNTKEET